MRIFEVLYQLPLSIGYFFKSLFDRLLAYNYTGGNGIYWCLRFLGGMIALWLSAMVIRMIVNGLKRKGWCL